MLVNKGIIHTASLTFLRFVLIIPVVIKLPSYSPHLTNSLPQVSLSLRKSPF